MTVNGTTTARRLQQADTIGYLHEIIEGGGGSYLTLGLPVRRAAVLFAYLAAAFLLSVVLALTGG